MRARALARADAAFGVADWTAEVTDQSGEIFTQAGGHPFKGVTDFTMNTTAGVPDGNVKDVRVDLPPGIISNPEATPKCTTAQYDLLACPASTQLGTEEITIRELILTTTLKVPIYNMVPPPGRVSDFSFGVPVISPRTQILGGVRAGEHVAVRAHAAEDLGARRDDGDAEREVRDPAGHVVDRDLERHGQDQLADRDLLGAELSRRRAGGASYCAVVHFGVASGFEMMRAAGRRGRP